MKKITLAIYFNIPLILAFCDVTAKMSFHLPTPTSINPDVLRYATNGFNIIVPFFVYWSSLNLPIKGLTFRKGFNC